MEALELRVRDREFIRVAVDRTYTWDVRTAGQIPEKSLVEAIVAAAWEPKYESSKKAFFGIAKAVKKLLDLFRKAPQLWEKLQRTLAIDGWESMNLVQKTRALGGKLRDLITEGKKALVKAFKKLTHTFPVSLFFVEKQKMPGLTDLINRIIQSSPKMQKALERVRGGIEVFDKYFQKYIPVLPRVLYSAIFIYIWLNVWEISWDVPGLVAGFTGQISLSELLSSVPESAIGALFAQLGFGTFAALAPTIILRLIWLVAQNYLEYHPGKGFVVHWEKMGIQQRPEAVPA